MRGAWKTFERWLSWYWPDGEVGLNRPATSLEIVDLQNALGVTLPGDYVACLKIHNGQRLGIGGLFEGFEYLSTNDVFAQWTMWKKLGDEDECKHFISNAATELQKNLWNSNWIPFARNRRGDYYCLDLTPGSFDPVGQVIIISHQYGERKVLAPDFLKWFTSYMELVFEGQVVHSSEFGGLFNREDVECS